MEHKLDQQNDISLAPEETSFTSALSHQIKNFKRDW